MKDHELEPEIAETLALVSGLLRQPLQKGERGTPALVGRVSIRKTDVFKRVSAQHREDSYIIQAAEDFGLHCEETIRSLGHYFIFSRSDNGKANGQPTLSCE